MKPTSGACAWLGNRYGRSRRKSRAEIARNMKRVGADFGFIAQMAGLFLTEIKRLN